MKRVLPAILLLLSLGAGPVNAQVREHRALVIFAQFPDLKFSTPAETFRNSLEALSAYYDYQFLGDRHFVFDTGPAVTLPNGYAYYGANASDRRDAMLHRLAQDACRLADEEVNFARYDNDSDGSVGDILIIVPGISEAEGGGEDMFWPQFALLEDMGVQLTLDKKRITGFATVPEFGQDGRHCGTGILAHEFGHILGLNDFYDTDGPDSGGVCKGLRGSTSLMDLGNRNDLGATPPNMNAIEREILGNGSCTVLDREGSYSLEPVDRQGRFYMIPGPDPLEYYLFEYRKAAGYDACIGGSGMLIYHIDKRAREAGWSTYYKAMLTAAERWRNNQINCNPDYECAYLAAPLPDSDGAEGAFWPQGSHDSFGSETVPSFSFREGAISRFALTGITAGPDGVSFKLIEPVRIGSESVFQASAIIDWELSPEIEKADSCTVEWFSVPEEPSSAKAASTGGLGYSCILEGLSPRTEYFYKIRVYSGKTVIHSLSGRFSTLGYRAGISRFIYLPGGLRNADGSFARGSRIPLTVYNSVGDVRTDWFFDGQPIRRGPDGLWEISASGTLMARVYCADGSIDTIIKEIGVR